MSRWASAFTVAALIACLGLIVPPPPVDAQQPVSPRRVGVLLALLGPDSKEAQAFRQGLRDVGYVEGRDVLTVCYPGSG